MEISIKSLYSTFLNILNKNNSEYISPEEFVDYLTLSSEDMYNDYLGNRNTRRTVFGSNSITDARLNPFKVTTPLLPYDPVTREVSKPELCKHITDVVDDSGSVIMYQDDNRFAMLRRDTNVDLNLEVYYREKRSTLEVLTRKPISGIVITYLKEPRKPKLPYTIVDREIVITDSGVVNVEWDEGQAPNLLNRMLVYAGITLKDATVMQIGRLNKSEE